MRVSWPGHPGLPKRKKEKKKRLIYGFIDENPPIGITNPKYTRVKSTHETNL
jgi:hypothetical protein